MVLQRFPYKKKEKETEKLFVHHTAMGATSFPVKTGAAVSTLVGIAAFLEPNPNTIINVDQKQQVSYII